MNRSSLFVTCVLSALVGCSSSTSGGTSTDGGTDTTTSGDTISTTDSGSATDSHTTTDTGTTTDSTPPGDGGPTDPTCAAKTTNKDCQSCCRDAHTDGYTAFAKALVTCACKSGNCDTACGATVCAATPMNPDTTCSACLAKVQGSGGACVSDIAAVCGDPSMPCYGFQQCIGTSKCNSLP